MRYLTIDKERVVRLMDAARERRDGRTVDLLVSLYGPGTFGHGRVTERIKTLDDAFEALGPSHPLTETYIRLRGADSLLSTYMRLRVVCAALNEGWRPSLAADEERYVPAFYLLERSELDDYLKQRPYAKFVYRQHYNVYPYFVVADSPDVYFPDTPAPPPWSLCLCTSELADYCARQFIHLWADFYIPPGETRMLDE